MALALPVSSSSVRNRKPFARAGALAHDHRACDAHPGAVARAAQIRRAREHAARAQALAEVRHQVRAGGDARAAVVGDRLLEAGHLGQRRGRVGRGAREQPALQRGHLPERLAPPEAQARAGADRGELLELVAVQARAVREIAE